MKKNELRVERIEHPWRLDSYLACKYPEHSRSYFQDIIAKGNVLVNGSVASKSCKLRGGEYLVWFEEEKSNTIVAQSLPLEIIYEDDAILVLNKPDNLVVHPACGHPDGTLLNALYYYAKERFKPYLVHRLDKDTTGVLVVAKNENSKVKLIDQFKNRKVEKIYLAVVKGVVGFKKAFVDAPLGRGTRNRFMVEVGSGAKKPSATEIIRVKVNDGYTVVEIRPLTGRTHQIRAHLSYIKHPVLGDVQYGGTWEGVKRPLLHAYKIKFTHPEKNKTVEFEAPIPDDIKSFI